MKRVARVLAVIVMFAASVALDAQDVYRSGDAGVTLPVVVKQVRPQYTAEATGQRIMGSVLLECVVREDGRVSDITVVESLDTQYGLDDEAVKALAQWEFKPGLREGKPVAVRITVVMNFALK